MIRIVKYLKSHALAVAAIVVLLIIQAVCDLALPSYTSDIVDVGIQQSGIEHAAPAVLRLSQYEKMTMFLGEEKKKVLENAYEPIDLTSLTEEKQKQYKQKYPLIQKETLCELKEKEDLESVEAVFKDFITLMRFLGTKGPALEEIKSDIISSLNMGTADSDIFTLLFMIPEEDRIALCEKIVTEQSVNQVEMMQEQMAIAYVQSEYEAIGMDLGALQNSYLLSTGLKMLGVSLLAMLTAIIVCYLAAKIAASIGMSLRGRVFKKVVSFSNAEMDKFSTASLITRSTNDIQQIQIVVVLLLRMICYAPILGIGGVLKVLATNVSMSWIIFVGIVAILCLVGVVFVVAMPKFKIMQDKVDRVNLVAREILTGLPVIRAFTTERHEEKRFDAANADLMKTQLFTNRVMSIMMPLMMLIMNGLSILIVWVGSKGIDAGNIQVGEMMAFITYTMQIVMSFLMLTMIFIMLPRAAVSAKRIDEVVDTELVIKEPKQPKNAIAGQQGVIQFEKVSFRYPGANENVIEDISFTAEPGKTTAFIGSTGSGKSTLINLIPRFYDVTEGRILLDGIDVREVSQTTLRDKIGYVPQKGVLFSGTIESNLKYGKEDLTEEEMKKAARIAQSTEFIEEKAEQYKSTIAQGGSNVSGGQKQRLSIARAIAKEPQIYIFDDSFSALDYKTDIALRKALKEETANSTVLIVAQRISTILHAEQIIVLDEGKIAGIGTHEELLAHNEAYQQIAYSQLSKKELEGGNANA